MRGICSHRRVVICPSGGLLTGVSSPICKNILVFTPPKSLLELFASHPKRGAYHDRHERRGGMRWTRQRLARDGIAGLVERLVSDHRHADERRFSRPAKSCGPDAPTLASSSRRLVGPTGQGQHLTPRTTVGKELGHRGAHDISRSK